MNTGKGDQREERGLGDLRVELRLMRDEINELRARTRAVLAVLVVMPTLMLVGVSLWTDAYGELEAGDVGPESAMTDSLPELLELAEKVDKDATAAFAGLTVLALCAVALTALAFLASRSAVPIASTAALLLLVWVALISAVRAGDLDSAGELGIAAGPAAWWPAAAGIWALVGSLLVRRIDDD